MKFEQVTAPDESWQIYPDGGIYVAGVRGIVSNPDGLRVLRDSISAALLEYERQVEAARPKPGEFEIGDTVQYHTLRSDSRYTVIDPFDTVRELYPDNIFLVEHGTHRLYRGGRHRYVKVVD